MISVLQVIDGKSFGGIAKLMFDVDKNISGDIKMDFLTATNIYSNWNNLNISRNSFKGRMIYNYKLFKFLRKNTYNIIHINSGAFFFTFQVLIISKLSGIKKVIVHSHNTPHISNFKKMLIKCLNPLYCKMIDKKLTCSNMAAKSLFTKMEDVVLIKNGINVDNFKYVESIREEYRKAMDIDGKVVYGNVGRLFKQKNHELLIDIFYEIQKKQDAVLLLIGDGELEHFLKEKVNKLKIDDKVLFLGFRKDVNNILNAIDIFIFPSLYEGLPISIIEAQTNGLPVFVSKGVSDEAKVTEDFFKINSNDSKIWAKQIIDTNINKAKRENAYIETINEGYDIKHTTEQLEKVYRELVIIEEKH